MISRVIRSKKHQRPGSTQNPSGDLTALPEHLAVLRGGREGKRTGWGKREGQEGKEIGRSKGEEGKGGGGEERKEGRGQACLLGSAYRPAPPVVISTDDTVEMESSMLERVE